MELCAVLLSWVNLHNPHAYRERLLGKAHELSGFWLFLTNSTEPRRAAMAISVGVILFIVGFWLAQGMQIGDSEVGVPELRP